MTQASAKMPRWDGKKQTYQFTQAQLNARDQHIQKDAVEDVRKFLESRAYPSAIAATKLAASLGFLFGQAWGINTGSDLRSVYTPAITKVVRDEIVVLRDRYQAAYARAHGDSSPELAPVLAKVNEVIDALNAIIDGANGWSALIALADTHREWVGHIYP